MQSFGQVVVGFFPTNVVQSFSANDIIPIILIAVTLSVAYLSLAEKEPEKVRPFRDGAEALKLVVFKVVGYVIRLTPYAIVALTAYMVGSSTDLGSEFQSLVGLLVLVWVACILHAYVINGVILEVFADVPMVEFFRKIFPAQLTAFTTQSSIGTLPVTTAQLTRKVGVHPEIAHFTAPLGATIGMPGCAGIWPIMIAVWGINAYGIQYTLSDYVVLAVLGVDRLDRRGRRARRGDGGGRHRDVRGRAAARVRRGDDPDRRDRRHGAHGDQRHRGGGERHRGGPADGAARRRDLRRPGRVRRRGRTREAEGRSRARPALPAGAVAANTVDATVAPTNQELVGAR